MKKVKYIICLITLITYSDFCFSQDTIILNGIPDFSFNGSTTYKLVSLNRLKVESSFEFIAKSEETIIRYLEAENNRNDSLAQSILKYELNIANGNGFGIQMMFFLFKLNEFNALYLPLFQVHDSKSINQKQKNRILISCSMEQLIELESIKTNRNFVCVYLGDTIIDNSKLFKLIKIE